MANQPNVFRFSAHAKPTSHADPLSNVFRFGATENIPTQVDASPRSWNAARLAVQKNAAEQATKLAAEQASAATEGSWVSRALSGFGIASAKDKEAGLRAAQAAAMLAGHSYIEKAQAEAKAQAAMAAEAEEAAAAARQEAKAQADAYAREAELEARVAAQLRECRAASSCVGAAAAAPPVLDLGSAAAKLSAAPAAQPTAKNEEFEFGDFEAAPAPVEPAEPVEPEPVAEEAPAEAPEEADAEPQLAAAPEEEPVDAAEVTRGLLSPEAQEAANLKQVVWSDAEDDGADEGESAFKPAMKVVILAKEDSFEAEAGTLRSVSLGMAPPPKSGGKRPRTPAPPTPVARRTRAGRKAASMEAAEAAPAEAAEAAEAPATKGGAGQKRGRRSGEAAAVADEAADEVAPRATRRQRCAA